ncbi:hypothetical protein C8J57DRAFT_1652295 [Mycena rebaudengoi]|nr:hypothetical protein C8J57DRAFT_1652295 [Mycena rebaudengoi]
MPSQRTFLKIRNAAFSRIEETLQRTNTNQLPNIYGEVDRNALYMDGLHFGKAMLEEKVDHKHSVFNAIIPTYWLSNASPFSVHLVIFIPALKLLASPEQLSHWLPLAEAGKIIGTCCQTELGHGSFLRGLETTATISYKI